MNNQKINKTYTEPNKNNMSIHDSPANNEWVNSFYVYNKNIEKNATAKNIIINKLLNMYFSMSIKKLRKSKRMSDFFKKSTIKQFFITRLETKQTNDKATITGYVLDRHRYYLTKKTFSFLRALKKTNIKTRKRLIPNINSVFINKKYMNYNLIINKYSKHLKLPKLNRNEQFSEFLKFHFLVWALSIFNFYININGKFVKLDKLDNNTNRDLTIWEVIQEFLKKRSNLISKRKKNLNILNKRSQKRRKRNEYTLKKHLYENNRNKYLFVGNRVNYKNLNLINLKLLNILHLNMKKSESSLYKRNLRINKLFMYFSNKYINNFNIIMKNIFREKYMLTRNLIKKWIFTKNKINGFLPFFKYLIHKIYGKKIEFNIVNLKYIQLAGDNFLRAVSTKLKRRKINYMNTIKKSLDIFNIDTDYKGKFIKENDIYFNDSNYINKFNSLNSYRGHNIIVQNKSIAEEYISAIFGNNDKANIKENKLNSDTLYNINCIKYKKLTGIKMIVNGRLTKRFTASRAQHKIRVIGSLENYDNLKNTIRQYQKPSSVVLRGNIKPNIQYSLINSKRRVGSFGIRSWISSN